MIAESAGRAAPDCRAAASVRSRACSRAPSALVDDAAAARPTVSERLPPASCIRMIAPGRRRTRPRGRSRDARQARSRSVSTVHITISILYLCSSLSVSRSTDRRAGGTAAGTGRRSDAIDRRLLQQLRPAVAGERAATSRRGRGVVADRIAVGHDLRGAGVEVVQLEHADLEERARHTSPARGRDSTCGVYGPGPSSNVSAISLCCAPAIRTYGV